MHCAGVRVHAHEFSACLHTRGQVDCTIYIQIWAGYPEHHRHIRIRRAGRIIIIIIVDLHIIITQGGAGRADFRRMQCFGGRLSSSSTSSSSLLHHHHPHDHHHATAFGNLCVLKSSGYSHTCLQHASPVDVSTRTWRR